MFSDLTKQLYTNYLSDAVLESCADKRSRIVHISNGIRMKNLVENAIKKVADYSRHYQKCENIASNYFNSALKLYSADADSHTIKLIIKKLSKSIIYAKYGEKTFIDAYVLRSKCFLKLAEHNNAYFDVNIAIKHDGITATRFLVKAISLFSQNSFKPLKDFFKSVDINSLTFDSNLEKEFEELGYGHLSKEYLLQFINDPNFANQTSKSSENIHQNSLHFMQSLLNFETNYELDPRCDIVNDNYKGRHLMAKEFIPKGTKLLVERSFSLVLDSKVQYEHCLYCHKSCYNSYIPCKYCINAVFCSDDCFEKAWNVFHRYECSLLPAFNDSFNASLHMYRTISRIGVKEAISVHKKMKNAQTDPEIMQKAKSENKTVKSVVCDNIIQDYLDNLTLRCTADFKQSKEQKMMVYQMLSTLLDHNEKYELYYDVCYMGVAIDVALLLLLNEYLLNSNDQNDQPFLLENFDPKTIIKMVKDNQSQMNMNDWTIFTFPFDHFVQLVEIVLLNIRKLGTNVFSWNLYDSNYTVKKNVGTCQCLVGSFINHSCDPNVEWDFKNGCIIYTALRDIGAGHEINNSYGPYTTTPFVERQSLLANNYYFNCRCSACQKEVVNFPNVLQCERCSGPVVCQQDSSIEANCMHCLAPYPNSKYRMKKVAECRIKFRRLLHFFEHQQSLSTDCEQNKELLLSILAKLVENIEYQIAYIHSMNNLLQDHVERFCRVMFRFGELEKACYLGQFRLPLHASVDSSYAQNGADDGDEDTAQQKQVTEFDSLASVEHCADKLQRSTFWFDLYRLYIEKYHSYLKADQQMSNEIFDHKNLLITAKQIISFYLPYIQRNVESLSSNLFEHYNYNANPANVAVDIHIFNSGLEDDGKEEKSSKEFRISKTNNMEQLFEEVNQNYSQRFEKSMLLFQ